MRLQIVTALAGVGLLFVLSPRSLGAADTAAPEAPVTGHVVNVAPNGALSLDREQCDLPVLSAKLKEFGALRLKPAIIIRSAETDYKYVMGVLDACKAAGLDNIAFATATPPETATPLWRQMQIAVLEKKDVAEVRRLLDAGFDPNGSIGCGDWPPLLGALNNVEMAQLLLERGAKVPDTAMLRACETYNLDMSLEELLVKHGGNVNASDPQTGETCLHEAVWHKNNELVKFLIASKNIHLNAVSQDGDLDGTPLMWALKDGVTDIAQLLVKAGTDTSIKGQTGITAADIIEERLAAYRDLKTAVASPASPSTVQSTTPPARDQVAGVYTRLVARTRSLAASANDSELLALIKPYDAADAPSLSGEALQDALKRLALDLLQLAKSNRNAQMIADEFAIKTSPSP